ncbi:winged helix-turn-helix domain-containing protein [Paraflavitalea speifideaquila]|uniref:winged helix-turn-helix domain-containing protein n=1 Tax=Paraflavitalea speifideaquila TaxID=3076558 RepID=UPI0028F130CB|nr:winged helix-turn-helix domain-containing protein [Paraflavitalea speifideiaquila]
MIRNIGHQVLLHHGDSSSRVLPVQQTGSHEYKLTFESPFTFIPDSLVQVIDRVVKQHQLPPTYLVEVVASASNEVIFGYSINQDTAKNIVPCVGRAQAKGCYAIKMQFPATAAAEASSSWYLMGGCLAAISLSLLGRLLYYRRRKESSTVLASPVQEVHDTPLPANAISIGRYLFYTDKQLLELDQESIPLTAKESKLLQIFAASPNEVIDRSRLLKEVWEDEGVIVGRSLDMFVSRLRKKLQKDPGISLINVHGKGYKLAVEV